MRPGIYQDVCIIVFIRMHVHIGPCGGATREFHTLLKILCTFAVWDLELQSFMV